MDDLKRCHSTGASPIILVALALMIIGLVMVASATASIDRPAFSLSNIGGVLGRQVLFVVCGLAAMLLTRYVAPSVLASPTLRNRVSQVAFLLIFLCLIAALLPSFAAPQHGSQRWLRLTSLYGSLGFQPSEFAKLTMVVILASLLARPCVELRSFRRGFLPPAVLIGLCCLLVGKEDLGTGALLALVGMTTLFVAGCRFTHLLLTGAVGVSGFVVLLLAAPYRMARITAFQDPWADPRGAGYQPIQSLTAIAQGGWSGTGLGGGVHKYGYLPESHSDFIFSLICEETGVLGAGMVIALFCTFLWLGLRTMWTAPSSFERLVAFGLTVTVTLQAAMNIAVVTVIVPTTGISLPFISAGGSGVLMFCVATGLLAAIAARGTQLQRAPAAGECAAEKEGRDLVATGTGVAAW